MNSYLYKKYLRKRNKGWLFRIGILFLGIIISIDTLIYLNIIDVRILPGLKIPKGVNPGKYWMFNPGLMVGLKFGSIIPNNDLVWDIFTLFFIISYIWWFTIGQNLSRFIYGRLEYEKGAWYLLRTTKMIKKSKDKLEERLKK